MTASVLQNKTAESFLCDPHRGRIDRVLVGLSRDHAREFVGELKAIGDEFSCSAIEPAIALKRFEQTIAAWEFSVAADGEVDWEQFEGVTP